MRKKIPLPVLEATKQRIRNRLLPKLECDPEDFELSVLDAGARGPVILCKGDESSLVCKMYRSPKRFLNAKRAHEYFAEHNIPSPRILDSRIYIDAMARLWRFLLVQEGVSGPGIHEIEDREQAIRELGKSLARMHSHRREVRGSFYVPFYRSLSRKFRRKLRPKRRTLLDKRFRTAMNRLAYLEQKKAFTQAEVTLVARSLEIAKSRIPSRTTYELIHGDFDATQVLMRDGKPTFIDLDTARFSNFGYELVRAKHSVCRTEAEQKLFLNSYFDMADTETLNWYETAERFLELAYHVGRAKYFFKRSKNESEESDISRFRQQYEFHKGKLIASAG